MFIVKCFLVPTAMLCLFPKLMSNSHEHSVTCRLETEACYNVCGHSGATAAPFENVDGVCMCEKFQLTTSMIKT